MKQGDLVVCVSLNLIGLVLDFDTDPSASYDYLWARIFWSDQRVTWEDINPKGDEFIKVVCESR